MNVAIAIICNADQDILITKRDAALSQGGLWEFPGGKLENNETPHEALVREIEEEVGLTVLDSEFIFEIKTPKHCLYVFLVTNFTGQAYQKETQQDLRWIPAKSLHDFEFPIANRDIIQWVQQRF